MFRAPISPATAEPLPAARWVYAVAVVLTLASSLPSSLFAQEESPDVRAQSLYRAGETAFHAGEYQAAFDLFQSAFDLSHRGALLHNMALCADRLRRDDQAAGLYAEYLERVPEAENRVEVDARLRALRAAIARHEQAPPVEVPAAAATVPSEPPRSAMDEPWFWPVIGGGAALVVAGVIIGVVIATQPTDEPYRTGDIGGVVFALELRP
jgi:tetratricopeptide (TPR) repeat protein